MLPASDAVYQLKVTLAGSRPPIWRRVLIGPSMTFQDLHQVIQLAMGWQCMHLRHFQLPDGTLIGDPEEDPDGMMNYVNEASIPLDAALMREKQRLRYEYEVVLEKILPGSGDRPVPSCIKAVRQCPPEDVGGIFGFYHFLEAAADPAHPEYEMVTEWMGGQSFDPEFVDLDLINEDIAQRESFFAPAGPLESQGIEDFRGLSLA